MAEETRYARSGDVHIAYQVFGSGPVDVVLVPGFISHAEHMWDEPHHARFLERLGKHARVVMFDKRGTGLSDRVAGLPDLDQRMDDVRAVMDAAGFERASLLGISEGGAMAILFAATYPERCTRMVLYGSFPQSRFWLPAHEPLDNILARYEKNWGSGKSIARFASSKTEDPIFLNWWAKFERLGASPSAIIALMRMGSDIDVIEILPSVRVPTLVIHRTGDKLVSVESGRLLADQIPNARLVEVPGEDHIPVTGESAGAIFDAIVEFVTGNLAEVEIDRVLATVLMTDIVGSTTLAQRLGDQAWLDLLEAHNTVVRTQFERFRGREVKSLGDGFLATFDGPARAIRCGSAIAQAVKPLGIEVRAGLHTGEVELNEKDVRGIAVHIAARISALAAPSEVLVSRTVMDLVAGSGLRFSERGNHSLKGLSEPVDLFAAA